MKRALVVLVVVFFAMATAVAAQDPADSRLLSFQVSGSALVVGSPSAVHSVLPDFAGKGTLGQITGQGNYIYGATGPQGQLICQVAQASIRVSSSGDVLMVTITPGVTGYLSLGPAPGIFLWTQTWTGVLSGGTGRFAGATGTFSMTAGGLIVVPALVMPFEGRVDVVIDPK